MYINKAKHQDKYWLPILVLVSINLMLPIMQFILTQIRNKRSKEAKEHEELLAKSMKEVNAVFPNNPVLDQPSTESKQIEPFLPDKIGEFPHFPHYNVRTAAQSYSNIAAILAGFAFTAVILVLPNSHLSQQLSEQATIAFLIAFFGCILSAFMFSVVSGEEILSPRTNMIALFGGIGFSISASLIFWGVVTLMKVFFHDEQIITRVYLVYSIFTLLQPAFLSATALDNTQLFKGRSPNWKENLATIIPSYLPFIAPLLNIFGFFDFSFGTVSLTALTVSGGIIVVSSIMALFMSYVPYKFELPAILSGLMIFLHSCVLVLLILTV